MNKLFYIFFVISSSFLIFSCSDDDVVEMEVEYDYHAHIHSPNADTKAIGDTIHVHVEFESHSGETVEHVYVRIYNSADGVEIYNAPSDAKVNDESGAYELHADVILSEANGINSHTDWVVEAKVWGLEDGQGESIETVEFHVHPE